MNKLFYVLIFLGILIGACSKEENESVKQEEIKEVIKILPKTIKLSNSKKSMFLNETFTIKTEVLPEDAENKTVIYTSSDISIATINENGYINAIGLGCTIITAKTVEGNISATCSLTVIPNTVKVEKIIINKSPLNLSIGDEENISYTVLPENATNKNVTFASSEQSIATVDKNGLVRALSNGHTIITIYSADNEEIVGFCGIIVKAKEVPKPDSIIPSDMIGNWTVNRIITCLYGIDYSEADMIEYSPQMEEQYAKIKKQFNFSFNSDDTIILNYITKEDSKQIINGVLTIKDAEKSIYTGTFKSENEDIKSIDFTFKNEEIMMIIKSLSDDNSQTKLFFNKK